MKKKVASFLLILLASVATPALAGTCCEGPTDGGSCYQVTYYEEENVTITVVVDDDGSTSSSTTPGNNCSSQCAVLQEA